MNLKTKMFSVTAGSLLAVIFALAAEPTATANPEKPQVLRVQSMERMSFRVLRGTQRLCNFSLGGYGPKWSWFSFKAIPTVQDKRRVLDENIVFIDKNKAKVGAMTFHFEAEQTASDTITLRCHGIAEADMQLTGMILRIPCGDLPSGATVETVASGGEKKLIALPPGRQKMDGAKSLRITLPGEKPVEIIPDLHGFISCEGSDMRVWLTGCETKFTAGQKAEFSLAIKFGEPVVFDPNNHFVDMKNWFRVTEFTDTDQGINDVKPGSVIGVEDWLDKPAGKHGDLGMKDDRFVFADGTPVKLWGANVSYSDMCKPAELVDRWADKFAKCGFNILRFHKWIGMGWAGVMVNGDRWKLDEEKIKQFDYFHAALAKRGIYSGWSPIAYLTLCPGDKEKMIAYDEIIAATAGTLFKNNAYTFVHFAPDLQDIYIQQTTDMLKRVNSVTGKRYADDPSLAYVEIQNEDDIFFFGIDGNLKKCPTYHKRFSEKLAAWLLKKYGTEEALRKAWNMRPQETMAEATVNPIAPGWLAPGAPISQRTLDRYQFMYDQQLEFYRRFEKAIRETGYKGVVIGSNWQGGSWLGHFYNVASDRAIGFVDRHNYTRDLMLRTPGCAPLSAGMQQVSDRPFGISEWGSTGLLQFDVAPIIAAYGMGLQGWDYSAQFSCNSPWIAGDLRGGLNNCCSELPNIVQYPTLARMIYRGDVKEGEIVSTRNVSMQELAAGKIRFEEKQTTAGADFKEFSGSVPAEALAVGRVVIKYSDEPAKNGLEQERLVSLLKPSSKIIRSVTGQLLWDSTGEGYITIDTPGTQGVIGYAPGKLLTFADATCQTPNPQANILMTALDKEASIGNARKLLVTTLGRTFDEGTLIDESSGSPLSVPEMKIPGGIKDRGEYVAKHPTLLIEPVTAGITLKRAGACKVFALDQAGRKQPNALEIPVEQSGGTTRFTVDGNKTKTFYYLVEFAK